MSAFIFFWHTAYDYVEADYDLHYAYEYDYEPAEPDSIDWLYDLVGTEGK